MASFAGNGAARRSNPWRRQAGGGCSWGCGGGGLVAGRVGVVGAEGAGCGEGLQPAGESGGDSGGGGDEGVGRQGGSQQQESREGVHGTFDEQDRVQVGGAGRQPEAAAGLAGAGGHALEGAAVGSGAGADELGTDGVLVAVAAEEDGIAAGVAVEDGVVTAAVEQAGIEAASGDEEVAHGRPETPRRPSLTYLLAATRPACCTAPPGPTPPETRPRTDVPCGCSQRIRPAPVFSGKQFRAWRQYPRENHRNGREVTPTPLRLVESHLYFGEAVDRRDIPELKARPERFDYPARMLARNAPGTSTRERSGLEDMPQREWLRLAEILPWLLAATLAVASGHAQFRPPDFRDEAADAERDRAEHERWRPLDAMQEARRARAHARLGSKASTVDPQASCPALVGPAATAFASGKGGSGPFVARSTPRPTRPGWKGVAPPSESASGLFGEYISSQVVQAKCVNCHVEGGV